MGAVSLSANANHTFYTNTSTDYITGYSGTIAQTKIYQIPLDRKLDRGDLEKYIQEQYITSSLDKGIASESFEYTYKGAPYMTAIGFYNKYNELLAVSKLSHPIQNPDDIELTFRIQLDMW